jgi:Pyruvate/2-oxoacid:ferredoxin oxidoreductase delta subunit
MTKEQNAARSRKWRGKNPERSAQINANCSLKRRYGITLLDKHRMVEKQGGKCALCERVLPSQGFNRVIDHDHVTMRIRGVICRGCNVALARFGDDKSAINKLIRYLLPEQLLEAAFNFGD